MGRPAARLPAQVPLLGATLPRRGGHTCVALTQRAPPRLSVGIRRAEVRAWRGGMFARGRALGAYRPRKHAGQAEHRPPQLALPRANLPLDSALRVCGRDAPRRLQRQRRPTRVRNEAGVRRQRRSRHLGLSVRRGGLHRPRRLPVRRRGSRARGAGRRGWPAPPHCQAGQRHLRPLRRDVWNSHLGHGARPRATPPARRGSRRSQHPLSPRYPNPPPTPTVPKPTIVVDATGACLEPQ
mmetsp:Transcript_34608/g.111173  ORF Transcript_34608/g.111173 Transcript_34608/m.111173 type:complete len:239 (-) Transcript_34608:142-858(-)